MILFEYISGLLPTSKAQCKLINKCFNTCLLFIVFVSYINKVQRKKQRSESRDQTGCDVSGKHGGSRRSNAASLIQFTLLNFRACSAFI